MASPTPDFKNFDAVEIATKTDLLFGVVMFMGPVDFAQGDDWVGIRLTSESAGKGKNDGSINGVSWFDAGAENNGVFVRAAQIKLRQNLTRLETLKLNREINTFRTSTLPPASTPISVSIPTPTPSSTPAPNPKPTTPVKSRLDLLKEKRAALAANAAKSAPSVPSVPSIPSATPTSTPPPRSIPSTRNNPTTPNSALSRVEQLRLKRDAVAVATAAKLAASPASFPTPTPTPTKAIETSEKTSSSSSSSFPSSSLPLLNSTQQQEEITNLNSSLSKTHTEISDLSKSLNLKSSEITALTNTVKLQISEIASQAIKTQDALDEVEALKFVLDKQSVKMKALAASVTQATDAVPVVDTSAIEALEIELSAERLKHSSKLKADEVARQDYQSSLLAEQGKCKALSDELTVTKNNVSDSSTLKNEIGLLKNTIETLKSQRLAAVNDQTNAQGQSLSQIAALTRKNTELEKSVTDTNDAMETMTLDAESLKIEKEEMQEKIEDMSLDLETAQIELEEVKEQLDKLENPEPSSSTSADSSDTDISQLSIQNQRLRDAVGKMREQMASTQAETSAQLRTANSELEMSKKTAAEVFSLRTYKTRAAEEIKELTAIVDNSQSYEAMVEELSERNLNLEDEIDKLKLVVEDCEQAAELSAEMEEVQAEELKEVQAEGQQLQTVITNLQQAIKTQRKKEDSLNETVQKHKEAANKLRGERNILLSASSDTSSEKKALLLKSQKALSKAARDAKIVEEMKSKEINNAQLRLDHAVLKMQVKTLRECLPTEVMGAEIAALNGDVVLQKCGGTCAVGLELLHSIWTNGMSASSPSEHEEEDRIGSDETSSSVNDTDVLVRMLATQCDLSELFVIGNMEAARVLCAAGIGLGSGVEASNRGKDVNTQQQHSRVVASTAISVEASHSFREVDRIATLAIEKLIKIVNDGDEMSDAGLGSVDNELFFREAIEHAKSAFQSSSSSDGQYLIPSTWYPEGWSQVKSSFVAQNACQATKLAFVKAKQQGSSMFQKLSKLSFESVKLTESLGAVANSVCGVDEATAWEMWSKDLVLEATKYLQQGADLSSSSSASSSLPSSSSLSTHLDLGLEKVGLCFKSKSGTAPMSEEFSHPLAPNHVNMFDHCLRYLDDVANVNSAFSARSLSLQSKLVEGSKSNLKLDETTTELKEVKLTLDGRQKDITSLMGKVEKLEGLLASNINSYHSNPLNTNLETTTTGAEDSASAVKLKKENIMLTEAIEVLHAQVDEYESELKVLKLGKTPVKKGGGKGKEAEGSSPFCERNQNRRSSVEISTNESILRPLLRVALMESSIWKAKATASEESKLKPLPFIERNGGTKSLILSQSQPQGGDFDTHIRQGGVVEQLLEEEKLHSACSAVRLSKAKTTVVSLKSDVIASIRVRRSREEKQRNAEILGASVESCKASLVGVRALMATGAMPSTALASSEQKHDFLKNVILMGRVKVSSGSEKSVGVKKILMTGRNDLNRLMTAISM